MRNIDTILEDMNSLINNPKIEHDPRGLEKYMKLYKEYLHVTGMEITETTCPTCGQRVDEPIDESLMKLNPKGKLLTVIYVCPDCRTETPMQIVSMAVPTDSPQLN